MSSKFTNVQRKDGPAVEVYEGSNFMSIGVCGFGGTFNIHMAPDEALALAEVIEAVALRVKAEKEASEVPA